MNIKEAERLSGVSRQNIRFYEKKGLLAPERNRENDYRNYSDEDIERLKLIRALRMVDMPLEQIKRIVDGELSLQLAVAQQKSELKSKIKRIETAVHFCDELGKVNELGIEEVLMRMDEPENRKLLSKNWPTDYAETAKRILIPLGAGLVPLLMGFLLAIPMILVGYLAQGYAVMFAAAFLGCWGYLGYKLYEKRKWILSTILFLVFPVAALVWALYPELVGANYPLKELPNLYFVHFITFESIVTDKAYLEGSQYLVCFAVNMACFCFGMLLRAVMSRRRKKTEEEKSAISKWFAARPQLQLALIMVLAIVLLLAPAVVIDLEPTEKHMDPSFLEDEYLFNSIFKAEYSNDNVYFEADEEFGRVARFDEWKRKYTWFGFGSEVVKIYPDERVNTYIQFFSNGVAKVATVGWMGSGSTDYFKIPDDVLEAVEEYIEAHKVADASE